MAQGGAAVTPMFLGAGFGMANQMMQQPAQPGPVPPPPPGFAGGAPGYAQPPAPPPPPPAAQAPTQAAYAPAGTVECGNCHSQVRTGAKFCDSCGTPMAKHCTNCNADVTATARFCAECGTPTGAPPSP
jgi:hypothetical protein